MDLSLLGVLACPLCKGELVYLKDQQELFCRFDQLHYPIQNGVPILVIDRAKRSEK